MFAAAHGNFEACELLVSAGAKVCLSDCKQRSALHYAALHENQKLIELLQVAFKEQGEDMTLAFGRKYVAKPIGSTMAYTGSPSKGDDAKQKEETVAKKVEE